MTTRLGIDDVRPVIDHGNLPAKGAVGEVIPVTALVWREGHDAVAANLVVYSPDDAALSTPVSNTRLTADPEDQDRVHGVFVPDRPGTWRFQIQAWSDPVATWTNAVTKKLAAGQSAAELDNDLRHGADLFDRAAMTRKDSASLYKEAAEALRDSTQDLTERVAPALSEAVSQALAEQPLRDLVVEDTVREVYVERQAALYNSWYELFPRSTGGRDAHGEPVHGTFATTAQALERVAAMGFDTVYFPPIHPIGQVHRKGKNNTLHAEPDDVGSPWAIADHRATHPELGTLDDFRALVRRAEQLGLEVALDLALQCSPDHVWAKKHPEYFTVLADGTIAYAENPPKKYQDIYPLNFDNAPAALYAEILDVVLYWVAAGVKTFRVDNPHTKPANFWAWIIREVHRDHPEVIFLAEAFTRPARLFGLAKLGFSQSYSYFTWKTTKEELTEFAQMHVEQADICRPNFFVNTPDILHASLQTGGRAMFAIRASLAATLSPLWGVYSGYELYEHLPVAPGSEEYLDSEKYELRPRDFQAAVNSGDSLEGYLRLLNQIRRENPALQQLRALHFHAADNPSILAYSKADAVTGNVVLVIINLDPRNPQEATVDLDLGRLGRNPGDVFAVQDMVTGAAYNWSERNFVRLEPMRDVAHIFLLPPAEPDLREQLAWREVTDYRA
ncbi:maltotransferase domain-containing protein [Corynebacterium sp. 32222D000AT]|uniref:maltotransferase domain-containing protein n=1 Tax=unclassified Corynebacterium TaxID=2624378 RepID=UPI002A932C71|nr:DUF3416 domain-containing protein [Mycobacteriaceae bacterium]MDY5829618.1 maltotransferase domain-containing protein [Corynebacterium sp.]